MAGIAFLKGPLGHLSIWCCLALAYIPPGTASSPGPSVNGHLSLHCIGIFVEMVPFSMYLSVKIGDTSFLGPQDYHSEMRKPSQAQGSLGGFQLRPQWNPRVPGRNKGSRKDICTACVTLDKSLSI